MLREQEAGEEAMVKASIHIHLEQSSVMCLLEFRPKFQSHAASSAKHVTPPKDVEVRNHAS